MQTGAELEHGEIDKTITYGRIYLFLVHIKMKKLLGILVLGLLICSTVFVGEIKLLNKSGFIFNDGKRVK